MAPEQIFSIANFLSLVCWLLLVALPGRTWVTHTIAGITVPAIFAGLYTVIIVVFFAKSEGGFSSLNDVALLFSNRWLLLAGWIHYLAFDLLVGTWEARDSRERGINHLFVVPCLIFTFMFGPAGWLCYIVMRNVKRRAKNE